MANSQYCIKITPRGSSNREAIAKLKNGTLAYPIGWVHWHRVEFRYNDLALNAATSQEIDLNVLYPAKAFPANVQRLPGAFIRVKTPISGGSINSATAALGDTGDPDGIFTATGVFTGVAEVSPSTPGAAENAARTETAYAPTLTLVASHNLSTATAGFLVILIPWRVLVP
jgi:hypothetical protein